MFPPTEHKGSLFSIFSPTFTVSVSLMKAILTDVKWHLIMVYICTSLEVSGGECLFIYLRAICMSSLEKCLFTSSAGFLNQIVWFFWLLSCMSYSYILTINPLSDVWFPSIFSHMVGCLFILLMIFFVVQSFVVCSTLSCLFLLLLPLLLVSVSF